MQNSMISQKDRESTDRLTVTAPGMKGPTFKQFQHMIDEAKKRYQEKRDSGEPFDLNQVNIKHPRETGRMSMEHKKDNFSGGMDSITFDLVFMSDGSSVQVNFSSKPQDPDGKGGGNTYQLDMGQFKFPQDKEKAAAALTAFSKMVIEAELKHHARGEPLMLNEGGGGPWSQLSREIMQQQVVANLSKFNELGIQVKLGDNSGQPFFDSRVYQKQMQNKSGEPEQEPEKDATRKAKPWDIPKVPKAPY